MIEVNKDNAAATAQAVKTGAHLQTAKSLAEAMCRVMEKVGYVQKDKQMSGGGSYRYVSVEAVIDRLRPEMIMQQLVLLPVGVETMHQGDHGRQVHLRVKYTFKMLHAPSGQSEPVVVIGEGMDVGDKSSNKAMTAARKYALLMAFNIETGLDPDDTPSRDQERTEQERAPAKPAAVPPQQKQQPKYAPRDNMPLRAKRTQEYAQAKTKADVERIGDACRHDIANGLMSEGDVSSLRGACTEALGRVGAAK